MRKYSLLLILIVCLISVLGCQKETLEENTTINQNSKGQNLKVFIFKSDSIIKANKALNRTVSSKFGTTNKFSSRLIESSTHGFVIDTSQVQLLASDYYDSYTFKIYRDQENSDILENYIVTFYEDDT
jgi:uncharacterized lipoprotein YehR (DUF1307 family)